MGKPFFVFEYKGFGGCDCVCDLEVYGNLVIATERDDNMGTSITNMAERLATAICQQFKIDPNKLIWIERYKECKDNPFDDQFPETLSLVQFNLSGGTHFQREFEFSKPRWVSITKPVLDALIDTHQ